MKNGTRQGPGSVLSLYLASVYMRTIDLSSLNLALVVLPCNIVLCADDI